MTAKEITIVIRALPGDGELAGRRSRTGRGGVRIDGRGARGERESLRNYMNKLFELWGRKVKWVIYESQYGDSTAEAQSKGKEGACADATYIKNNLKPFGVYGGSNVFAECAAERGMVTFWGGAYFPERWYDKYHPYVWHTTMDCERISRQVAEYIVKRLAQPPGQVGEGRDAQEQEAEVRDVRPEQRRVPVLHRRHRAVAAEAGRRSRESEPVQLRPRHLPVPGRGRARRRSSSARRTSTTVVMACDPISMIFLTQNAKAQNWFPEWFNIGVALNDVDNYPRTWDARRDQRRALRHEPARRNARSSSARTAEAPTTYKKATGTKIPEGTDGGYNQLTFIYNALQAAGPNLTPKTMADGIFSLPPGGAPKFAIGYISYRDGPDGKAGATDHTGIDDSREIWWNPHRDATTGRRARTSRTTAGSGSGTASGRRATRRVFTK